MKRHPLKILLQFHERGIKTPFYEVRFNANGQIVSILDCEQKRELVQENKVANHFKLYEDKPMDYDNWDIEMYYSEKYYDITDLTMFEWTQVGPVRAVLKVEYAFSQSRLCQEIVFYSQSRRIDFNTYVDYKEKQHLLKVHFQWISIRMKRLLIFNLGILPVRPIKIPVGIKHDLKYVDKMDRYIRRKLWGKLIK